jgi:HlyD family secretion protein
MMELSLSKNRATLEFLDNSIKNLSTKLASSTEIEAMNKRLLDGGFISKREYLESLERKLDADKEFITTANSRSETSVALQSLQQEFKIFKREYNQKLLEELVAVRRERDSLGQALKKTDLRSGLMEIRAPMDAVVLEIANRSVGSVVTQAAPFITLAPLDAELNVHAYVQPGDINQIKVGDEAKLKLDAHPFQKYGILKGRILRITRDVVRPDFRGVTSDKDYYVVVVDYNLPENARFLKEMSLLPGMTLSAEILIGERTIMSYLTYPIIRIKDESLNEKR